MFISSFVFVQIIWTTPSRGGSRDFEKGWRSISATMATKKILGFRWSKKANITLKTIGFWQSILSAFSIFLHFYIKWKLANEISSICKICKRFDKESEKTLMQQSKRKKLRKVGLCFIKGGFIKSFNMIINHLFVLQAHSQLFNIRMTQGTSKGEVGNGK